MATKETVTIAVRYVLTATKPVDKTIPFDKQSQNSKTNNWTIPYLNHSNENEEHLSWE